MKRLLSGVAIVAAVAIAAPVAVRASIPRAAPAPPHLCPKYRATLIRRTHRRRVSPMYRGSGRRRARRERRHRKRHRRCRQHIGLRGMRCTAKWRANAAWN
jgi:hypothetical protein